MNIPRSEAILRIKKFLGAYAHGRRVTCQVAAEEGLFCQGFNQYSIGELQRLYDWLSRPGMSREDLIQRAIQYETGRMFALDAKSTCDAHELDHDFCGGFPHFSNEELKRLCPRVFRPEEVVVDDP